MVAIMCQGALSSWRSPEPTDAGYDATRSGARPSPAVVELRGLPKHLCNVDMMNCMLEQAGLEGLVVGRPVFKSGKASGQAIIFFASAEAAETCVALFQDCVWDCNVKAELVLLTADQSDESEDLHEPLLVISACAAESLPGDEADPRLPAKVDIHSLYCSPDAVLELPPGLSFQAELCSLKVERDSAAHASGDIWEKESAARTSSTRLSSSSVDSASDLDSQIDE